MSDSRCDQYRDALELWTLWWNGPGRREYHDVVLPPLRKTAEDMVPSGCGRIKRRSKPTGSRMSWWTWR